MYFFDDLFRIFGVWVVIGYDYDVCVGCCLSYLGLFVVVMIVICSEYVNQLVVCEWFDGLNDVL